MSHLLVLGDLNLDIHANVTSRVEPGDEARDVVTVQPGGSAGTFARTAAEMGAHVVFVGSVGRDLVGDLLEASLQQHNIDARLFRDRERPSGAVLAYQQGGERNMVCARGANDGLTDRWVDEHFPAHIEHLHVSGYALLSPHQRPAAFRALDIATQRSVSVSVDPPPANLLRSMGAAAFLSLLPNTTWLFPNESEGSVLSGQEDPEAMVDALSARFPLGALTRGNKGAIGWSATQRDVQAIEALASVDSTGAGDVFAGTFVCTYLASEDLQRANHDACAAAAAMLRARLANG